MKRKTKRRVCGGIAIIAIVFWLGSVGALELGQISLGRGMAQMLGSLVILGWAAHKGGFTYRRGKT